MNMLSVAQVAERLNVSTFTVRRLIRSGDIRAVNIGARVLVADMELQRIMVNGTRIARVKSVRRSGQMSAGKETLIPGSCT